MKKISGILLLELVMILMAFNGYPQAGNKSYRGQARKNTSKNMHYDTLKTESHIAGLEIALLHEGPDGIPKDYPVLFLHGSVIPVNVSFGLRMGNYSWMDNLAENGYDVYALDFLGYGNSDRYPEMRSGSFAGKLPGKATDVCLDVDKAVDFICKRTGKSKVYLIGHSWGGSVAALYAGRFNDKIAKLVLYAAITVRGDAAIAAQEDSAKPTMIQSVYATMTPAQRVETFKELTPAGKECRMESEMFGSFGHDWLLSDPLNKLFKDDSVRYPSGPEQDTEDLLHNKTYYDPRDIQAPVLVIRGEWDQSPSNKEAVILFAGLENAAYKKYVVIEKATHILHLEKSRFELYEEVLFSSRREMIQSIRWRGMDGENPTGAMRWFIYTSGELYPQRDGLPEKFH